MKRILIYFAAALALLLSLASCEKKPVEYAHTIGLGSEKNALSASGGSTPVIVWSNTSWTARFDNPVDWASLDRLKGEGIGQVIFSYETNNTGEDRSVSIIFSAGDEECSILMVQTGS